MTEKTLSTPVGTPVGAPQQTQKTVLAEKPFPVRMQRLLTGKPQEETILDPDNPNLLRERLQD